MFAALPTPPPPSAPLLTQLFVAPNADQVSIDVRIPADLPSTIAVLLRAGTTLYTVHQQVVSTSEVTTLTFKRSALEAALRELRIAIQQTQDDGAVPELWLMLRPGTAPGSSPTFPTDSLAATPGDLPGETEIRVTGGRLLPYPAGPVGNGPSLPISALGPDCIIGTLASSNESAALLVGRDESNQDWVITTLPGLPELVRSSHKAMVAVPQWSSIVQDQRRFGVADVSPVFAAGETLRVDYWYNGSHYYDVSEPIAPGSSVAPDLHVAWNAAGEPVLEQLQPA